MGDPLAALGSGVSGTSSTASAQGGINTLLEYRGNIRRLEGTKLKRKKQKPRDSENWRCFVLPKAEREEKAGSVYSTDEGGSCSFSIYFSIPGVLFQEEMGDQPFQMPRQRRSDGNGDTECWGIETQ